MDPAVRANAYAISFRLLGRPGPAGAVADAVAREVERTGGVATPEWLGFLAAEAVSRSLAVAEEAQAAGLPGAVDDGPRSGEREALRRRFRRATGEQRAAAALVHLAGYPTDVVATHLDLPEDRVVTLAAIIAPPHGVDYRQLGDPSLRRGAPSPATAPSPALTSDTGAVPVVEVASAAPATGPAETTTPAGTAGPLGTGGPSASPQGTSTAPGRVARTGGRRRRRRHPVLSSLGGAAAVVAVLTLGASLAVGPRPTLGEPSPGVSGAAVGRDVVPLPSAGCTAAPAASGLDAATATGGAASRSVSTLEGDRGYRLWTPPPVPTGPAGDGPADGTAATPTPRPLVIAVPGFGRTADAFAGESGLEASLGAGSLVATLDPAAPALEVNVAQDTTRPDDLLYALTVYDDVASSYCVDLNRTAVVGHGPGGQLAGALACTRPEYFAAVVAVHGAFLPDPCLLDPPVSFLGIWTADDAVLPVSGGEGVDLPTVAPADPPPARVPAPPADEVLQGWAGLIGATGEERLSEQDGSVVTTLRAPGGATAQSVIRPTGGHAWPAGIEARIGPFLTDHARAPG